MKNIFNLRTDPDTIASSSSVWARTIGGSFLFRLVCPGCVLPLALSSPPCPGLVLSSPPWPGCLKVLAQALFRFVHAWPRPALPGYVQPLSGSVWPRRGHPGLYVHAWAWALSLSEYVASQAFSSPPCPGLF